MDWFGGILGWILKWFGEILEWIWSWVDMILKWLWGWFNVICKDTCKDTEQKSGVAKAESSVQKASYATCKSDYTMIRKSAQNHLTCARQ